MVFCIICLHTEYVIVHIIFNLLKTNPCWFIWSSFFLFTCKIGQQHVATPHSIFPLLCSWTGPSVSESCLLRQCWVPPPGTGKPVCLPPCLLNIPLLGLCSEPGTMLDSEYEPEAPVLALSWKGVKKRKSRDPESSQAGHCWGGPGVAQPWNRARQSPKSQCCLRFLITLLVYSWVVVKFLLKILSCLSSAEGRREQYFLFCSVFPTSHSGEEK